MRAVWNRVGPGVLRPYEPICNRVEIIQPRENKWRDCRLDGVE